MPPDFWWGLLYFLSLATLVVVAFHMNTDDED